MNPLLGLQDTSIFVGLFLVRHFPILRAFSAPPSETSNVVQQKGK